MRLLGIDPGEHNGWCILDYTMQNGIVPVDTGTTRKEQFYKDLETLLEGVNFLIVEDFAVRPNYAKSGAFDWDRMSASQVIGAIHYLSVTRGIPMVLQSPSVKPSGYGFLGKEYRKGAKNVHHLDAQAHAVYYLVTRMNADPPAAVRGEPIVKQRRAHGSVHPVTQKQTPRS